MKMEKPVDPKSEKEGEFEKYEIEDAVRTLIRAEEIKQDPKLMAACTSHLEKQKKAINSISGLRKKAAELDKQDMESPEEDSTEPSEE